MKDKPIRIPLAFALVLGISTTAEAYVGPGAGISLLGSLLGLIGVVLLALGSVLLWPVRRLLKKRREQTADAKEETRADPAAGENC